MRGRSVHARCCACCGADDIAFYTGKIAEVDAQADVLRKRTHFDAVEVYVSFEQERAQRQCVETYKKKHVGHALCCCCCYPGRKYGKFPALHLAFSPVFSSVVCAFGWFFHCISHSLMHLFSSIVSQVPRHPPGRSPRARTLQHYLAQPRCHELGTLLPQILHGIRLALAHYYRHSYLGAGAVFKAILFAGLALSRVVTVTAAVRQSVPCEAHDCTSLPLLLLCVFRIFYSVV